MFTQSLLANCQKAELEAWEVCISQTFPNNARLLRHLSASSVTMPAGAFLPTHEAGHLGGTEVSGCRVVVLMLRRPGE